MKMLPTQETITLEQTTEALKILPASFLPIILKVYLISVSLLLIVDILNSFPSTNTLLFLPFLFIGFATLFIMRQRQIRLASRFFVLSLWAGIATSTLYWIGTSNNALFFVFLLIIFITTILLGSNDTILVSGLTILVQLGRLIIESRVIGGNAYGLSDFTLDAIILILISLLLSFSSNHIQQILLQLWQNQQALLAEITYHKQTQAKLEVYKTQLETLVDERTQELMTLTEQLQLELQSRQQQQQALQKSEERLQYALIAANQALWEWNFVTNEGYFSPSYFTQLGYEPDEMPHTSETFYNLLHPDDLLAAQQRDQAFNDGQLDSQDAEFQMREKSGQWRWIWAKGKIVEKQSDGKPIRIIGVHLDIDERKKITLALHKAQEQANSANQAKSVFLANMSHELRTPLAAIIGYSELLIEQSGDSSDHKLIKRLKSIQVSANHLLNIISDILDISKIEAGQMGLVYEIVSIQLLIENSLVTASPLIEKNNNTIQTTYASDLGDMYGDALKIQQILLNLLSNAAKFTQNGHIKLNATRQQHQDGEWFVCQIIDTGIGITEDQLRNIFNPFTQADVSTIRQFGGTGLGLAISQQFCLMMGGRLEVKSQIGQGSTFTIYLPILTTPPSTDGR